MSQHDQTITRNRTGGIWCVCSCGWHSGETRAVPEAETAWANHLIELLGAEELVNAEIVDMT